MKIGFLTAEAVVYAEGGPYTKIMEIKSCLEMLGHQVDLINIWEFSRRLKEYDILHLVGANLSTYGLARTLMYNKIDYLAEPVFFSLHSYGFLKFINKIDEFNRKLFKGLWLDYGFIRDICKWSKLVIPNTNDEMKLIEEGFSISRNKIKVIPNGVNKRFLNADPSLFIKQYGIKDFILNVGHIGPKRKNVLSLVHAVEKMNHPLVIIGKMLRTGESDEVKKIAERNKNIIIIDSLPNNSPLLASAYAACSTFVLPSLFETPGIAALEAALAGAKVVITPFGGTKDYFQDMADYVDPHSVESIKKGIESSINKTRGDKLKQFISENFLWETVSEKTLRIYEEAKNINR